MPDFFLKIVVKKFLGLRKKYYIYLRKSINMKTFIKTSSILLLIASLLWIFATADSLLSPDAYLVLAVALVISIAGIKWTREIAEFLTTYR